MTSQLERLAKPIPGRYVKEPAPGMFGNYVDHEIINQILLEIVGPFSFEIKDVFRSPDGLIDGCTASLTVTVDGREVTITEAGGCAQAQHSKSQGDRLKKAASDALKRCAMRLSLALHVWAGERDYFLYDHLTKDAGGTGERRPAPPSEAPPTADSTTQPDGGNIGKNKLQQLRARASALVADDQPVAARRTERGLPKIDANLTDDQATSWDLLLMEMEQALEKPFEAAK